MGLEIPKSLKILQDALTEKQMSAYALAFRRGSKRAVHCGGNHGHPGTGAIASPTEARSLFDLASLTKIFVTSALIHKAKRAGLIALEDSYQKYFPEFPHATISLKHLLEHNSGLPAHIEFFKRFAAGEAQLGDTKALRSWIYEAKTAGPPGAKTEYSDLGFMLLGFLLEKILARPLAEIFQEQVVRPLGLDRTGFVALPHSPWQNQGVALHFAPGDFVATEVCLWRGRVMQGEVHDDNTWSMGGIAGHAGLFSTAPEALTMFDTLVEDLRQDKDFIFPAPETRAWPNHFDLGLMVYPGLRAFPGNDFAGALGHTGFVGTSAWHDPTRDISIVLLTNRVHPKRDDQRWIETRLKFHQSLWTELS